MVRVRVSVCARLVVVVVSLLPPLSLPSEGGGYKNVPGETVPVCVCVYVNVREGVCVVS